VVVEISGVLTSREPVEDYAVGIFDQILAKEMPRLENF